MSAAALAQSGRYRCVPGIRLLKKKSISLRFVETFGIWETRSLCPPQKPQTDQMSIGELKNFGAKKKEALLFSISFVLSKPPFQNQQFSIIQEGEIWFKELSRHLNVYERIGAREKKWFRYPFIREYGWLKRDKPKRISPTCRSQSHPLRYPSTHLNRIARKSYAMLTKEAIFSFGIIWKVIP